MKYKTFFRNVSATIMMTAIAGAVLAADVVVSFVHTNDVDLMSNHKGGRGGLDKVLSVVNAERREKGNKALFIHAGDAYSPSLMSRFDKGQHIVDLLNIEKPDVFVPGNHEFDFGEDIFRQRITDSQFSVLAANLTHPEGDKAMAGIKATKLIEIDGVKIGFVGGIEEDAAELSNVGRYRIGDVLTTAKTQAAALREAGADFVVAVLSTSWVTDKEAVDSHEFDLVLSGDDHDLVAFYDGKTAHAESASQGDFVNIVDISFTFNKSSWGPRVKWRPNFRIIDTENIEPLPAAAELVTKLNDSLSAELDQVVFTVPSELVSTKSIVRTEETSLGNLIADATRAATGADVSIINTGSIRGNKVYEVGHKFTYRDVLTELPFGNTTLMLEVSGQTLWDAFENAVSQVERKAGRFAQISGAKFSYDPSKDVGSRLISVSVGGKPLDKSASYKLAVNNYVYGGGDGYKMFADAKVLINKQGGDKVSNQVIQFLQSGHPKIGLFGRVKPIR